MSSPAPPFKPSYRLHFTLAELVHEQRIPRRRIVAAMKAGRVRHRRRGRRIELHPEDVEREFGWPADEHQEEQQLSLWAVREAEELLG